MTNNKTNLPYMIKKQKKNNNNQNQTILPHIMQIKRLFFSTIKVNHADIQK